MKEIKTFSELDKIENDKYDSCCSLDLLFIRQKIRLIDGYALIIGADCHQELELFFISDSFYQENKEYLDSYY